MGEKGEREMKETKWGRRREEGRGRVNSVNTHQTSNQKLDIPPRARERKLSMSTNNFDKRATHINNCACV